MITTTGKYILDEHHNVVEETDLIKWAMWMEDRANMVLQQEKMPDGVIVSTIFLGLDASWGHEDPVYFETMIFGGDRDCEGKRASTYQEALETHRRMVASLFEV